MAVQKEILKRTEAIMQPNPANPSQTRSVEHGTGVLIGGTPGQIYDVAYGPVVHTTTLTASADIGSFVDGQGIIVNAPEYALYGTDVGADGTGGPLAPSLTLPTGAVVSCMTAGHVWMKYEEYNACKDKANVAIIWQQAGSSGADLVVVEINGLTAYGPGSDSNANG